MNKWVIKHVKDIADVTMGQSPQSEFYNNDGTGLPFLQGNRTFGVKYPIFDTFTTAPNKIAEVNDVIMSVRAPVGDLNITPVKMCLGRGVCALKPKNGNYQFLYYLLSCSVPIILSRSNGTVYDSINRADIEKMRINIPETDEIQIRIADILSAYDDAIENNNRRIALLEKAARELYREWFVRFRFPGHESARFVNGLPEGWAVKRLGVYGKIKTGKTPPTENKENYGNEIMFVKTPDMHGDIYVIATGEYISKKGHLTQPKKLLPANSIMVSCIGTGGVVALNAEQAHTNQQINSIIPDDKRYMEWLFFTCQSLKETIELFGGTGTTMTNLSKGKFERLKVIEPPQTLIETFHDKIKDSFIMIKKLMKQSQNLARQRDLLLLRLMSGKLEV